MAYSTTPDTVFPLAVYISVQLGTILAMETMQFGVHLMFDGYEADQMLLSDTERLTQLLYDVPAAMNMKRLNDPVVLHVDAQNEKDSGGCSGFVMIAESHISFHTFPKRGFVTADIYTCQNDLDTGKFTAVLKDAFGTQHEEVTVLPRGNKYPVQDIHT